MTEVSLYTVAVCASQEDDTLIIFKFNTSNRSISSKYELEMSELFNSYEGYQEK